MFRDDREVLSKISLVTNTDVCTVYTQTNSYEKQSPTCILQTINVCDE